MSLPLAFYGVGESAQPYLQALAKRSDVQVVAVCDADQRLAEQVAAGWNAKVFPDPDSMLQSKPAAVWVCVPPRMQGKILTQIAGMEIPFFVEPPGSVDFDTARICQKLVQEKSLVSAVGYYTRYSDLVQEAKEYLGANSIPLALGWWLCTPMGDESEIIAADLLWMDACRMVDVMRNFCGEVTRVRALTAGAGGEEGGLVVQLEFDNGTVGMLTCASFARPAPRIELEMLGEGWSINLGRDLATLQLDEYDKSTLLRCLNQPRTDLTSAFIDAVRQKDPNLISPSFLDAFHTMGVCYAAGVSAGEGKEIAIGGLVE